MNGLKTDHLGGVPFDWDDWKWEQDGVRNAFFGLLSAWGIDPDDSFIISGCTSTPNGLNFDIAEGFISLNGEIYKVSPHSVVAALPVGNVHFWKESVTFDPAGLEATKNAGSVNTYEIRQAIVSNDVEPVPNFMPMVAETIHKKVYDKITPFATFNTIDLENNTNITQNDGTRGAGNDISLVELAKSGSYLKYQIIGKLIHVTFLINQIKNTTNAASSAESFVIRNLPFNFKTGIDQFGSYRGITNNPGANHRQGELFLSGNSISFDNYSPTGTHTTHNASYSFNNLNQKSWVAIATLEDFWTLRGNFIAEID